MLCPFELMRAMRKKMSTSRIMNQDACPNMLQIHVLHMISEHQGITMKEVAGFMKVSSPSATTFVNRLVNLGWVERVADIKNRKLVRLKMTLKGEKVLKDMMTARHKAFELLLSGLPQADQQDFIRILQKLLDNAR
jgi:DNA-binding MarR family transcriptional regulator